MKDLRKRNSKNKHKEKGFIMIVAIIITAFLLLLAVPFLFQVSSERKSTERSYQSISALSLAEAGVERAIWEINYGDISSWSGDSSERTMTLNNIQSSGGDIIGNIEIRVENPDGDTPVIESTGSVALTGSQTVDRTVRVELDGFLPCEFGAYGETSVYISSNAMVDSYDSRVDDYDPLNPGSEGNIGTNAVGYASIELDSNAEIFGDAIIGQSGDPDDPDVIITNSNATINGVKKASTELKEMEPVSPPEGITDMGTYYLGGSDTDTISQSGEYNNFNMDSNAIVTITGDITLYVSNNFSMTSNSQLIISTGSSLKVYIGGSFTQDSNTIVDNSTQDPTKCMFLGLNSLTGTIEWNSNATFYGAVYAPRADIIINSNADFYGSMMANSIYADSDIKIHYDKALERMFIPGVLFEVLSWQEIILD